MTKIVPWDEKIRRVEAFGERPLRDRFWEKVAKGKRGDCWEWTGARKRPGSKRKNGRRNLPYGYLNARYIERKKSHDGRGMFHLQAHRLAYHFGVEPIPKGKIICHKCHNPLCCNPSHLYAGTPKTNARDMVEAGRSLSGKKNPRALLTAKQVDAIRRARRRGIPLKALADHFGVHFSTVDLASRGKDWNGVPLKEPPVPPKLPPRITLEVGQRWERDGLPTRTVVKLYKDPKRKGDYKTRVVYKSNATKGEHAHKELIDTSARVFRAWIRGEGYGNPAALKG